MTVPRANMKLSPDDILLGYEATYEAANALVDALRERRLIRGPAQPAGSGRRHDEWVVGSLRSGITVVSLASPAGPDRTYTWERTHTLTMAA